MPGLVVLLDFQGRADLEPRFRRQLSACQLLPWHQLEGRIDPSGRLGLGRAHLGVFNLADQPLVSADGRFWLAFAGELYDRPARLADLRARGVPLTGEDSPDLLLAAYLDGGLEALAPLNGSYFFALWDAEQAVLTLGGDRYGNRPHLYGFSEGRFLLAPELHGVLAGSGTPPRIHLPAVASFLAMEHPLGEMTPVEGIQVFPAGSFLRLSTRGAEWQRYWQPRYTGEDEPRPRPIVQWLEPAIAHFRRAVARTAEGHFCQPLSGGSDSRLVAACMSHHAYPAWTYGVEASDDVRYARRVASVLGLEHHVLAPTPDYLARYAEQVVRWGGGMVSLFHSHSVDHGEAIRAIAPVVVEGMTAEYFRAEQIETMLAEPARSPLHRAWLLGRHAAIGHRPLRRFPDDASLVALLMRAYWSVVPPTLAGEVLAPGLPELMAATLRAHLSERLARIEAPVTIDRVAAFNVSERQRRFSTWGLKLSHAYVENRKPFDDYELVDFLLTLPYATRRRVQITLIQALAPALAALPRTGTNLPIDASFARRGAAYLAKEWRATRRPKRMQTFADPQQLLRDEVRRFYQELLLDPATLQNGYFQPAGLQRLVASHMAGEINAGSALCALATFELWRREHGLAARPEPSPIGLRA